MFDFLSFIIFCFLIGFLVLIILVGIKFFHNVANVSQSRNSYSEETEGQLTEDSNEDSQADLYLTEDPEDYDNLMFPEETDD
jgi:hypothetical protein